MSHPTRREPRGFFAAFGRALVVLVTMLTMLAPSPAWAGTPYSVHWVRIQDSQSCESAILISNGGPFFRVNDTPLPTYQIPGALVAHADGSESNTAEAGFDSVLLRTGANGFSFGVENSEGDNSCVHSREVVNLVSAQLGLNKPLFDVRRDGTSFIGDTLLDLSLAEINPPLARDIANLEAAIAAARKTLIDNASKTANLAAQLRLLQQLDTELRDLVTRPLDEIAQTDLDEILDRYAEVVDQATKAALDQLILDLQQSVLDLENELASLIDNFGAQADAVANLVTQGAAGSPDDPSLYALSPGGVPWVDIPDISSVPGAFDPGNDPYAAYADKVIAALKADVSGGKVTGRADFVANVRAWRANEAALQKALMERPHVSQAETSALLNGQNLVTSYVHQFMDASDWFTDSPVPADLRSNVDGVLKQDFGELADEMKDGLNLWQGLSLTAEMSHLCDTINAFAGAMSAIGDAFTPYVETMGTLVHATERIAIGFVPYVGPALDLCEAVTGKEWCLPSGKELSTEERIFSGVGFAISGGVQVWGGVKNAALKPVAKEVAKDIAQFGEELSTLLRGSRRTFYKTLRGAITSKAMDEFERKAVLHLMKDEGRALIGVGDDGVRQVLGIPRVSPPYTTLGEAPDFLSVTKGNRLAVSEAKGGTKISVAEEALPQLTNAMNKMKEKGLAGDVDRVEIIMSKWASFSDKDYRILDGYLVKISDGNKPVSIDGFNKVFVKIVQI